MVARRLRLGPRAVYPPFPLRVQEPARRPAHLQGNLQRGHSVGRAAQPITSMALVNARAEKARAAGRQACAPALTRAVMSMSRPCRRSGRYRPRRVLLTRGPCRFRPFPQAYEEQLVLGSCGVRGPPHPTGTRRSSQYAEGSVRWRVASPMPRALVISLGPSTQWTSWRPARRKLSMRWACAVTTAAYAIGRR